MESNCLYNFSSVENLASLDSKAIFIHDSASVFDTDEEINPIDLGNNNKYIPWGVDNDTPYKILEYVENDETLSTCQMFNSEICYGAGLEYNCSNSSPAVASLVNQFFLENNIPAYFLGVCQDFKFFGFAVSVIILSKDRNHISSLYRKEACYCRFAEADKQGIIPKVYYGNWRKENLTIDDVEAIDLLNPISPWFDLKEKLMNPKFKSVNKFAILTKIPNADNNYYPSPNYTSIFKGKWYNIKQLIGIAKEASLKNSAPIKYQIEISNKYWDSIFQMEGITDPVKRQERVVQEKQNILDFLTGAENSGKVWFTMFYTNPNNIVQHDVIITKIDSDKQGGDWSADIQEAINMLCFSMRVHSNLVGSVPGKSQSNNSGSDKRELYTIAQALQKPYHDLLFTVHYIIINYNKWTGVIPQCPFIMLSTLDENRDAKLVNHKNN